MQKKNKLILRLKYQPGGFAKIFFLFLKKSKKDHKKEENN